MSHPADPAKYVLTAQKTLRRFAAGAGRLVPAMAVMLLAGVGLHAQSTFAPLAVGSTSAEQNVTVPIQRTGAVAKIQVLTAGASGLDFAKGTGTSTCVGAAVTAGGSCTQPVTFTPSAPGLRTGAVVLLDGSGNLLGEALISGMGKGGLGVLITGNIELIAGQDGLYTTLNDGKPATQGELDLPADEILDGAGNLYIADSLHNRIRMVCGASTTATILGTTCTQAGIISTIAGNGNSTPLGDGGPAAQATLNLPDGLALDGAGNLYIADTKNNAIRKITAATGIITTVVGGGSGCGGQTDSVGDGCPATSARLNQPWGVTVDASGNLYVADTGDHRIRKVDAATGIITTVVGTGFTNPDGTGGYSGDGGPATSAELNRPYAVAFDAAGNMYIPDTANNRIRKVDTLGVITTFAGNGTAAFSGDGGPANQAELWAPAGVTVDPAGNVYISDTQNAAIRKVNAVSGIITTLIRNGTGSYYYQGNFIKPSLYGPLGIHLDGKGDIYVADYYDMVVREVHSNLVVLNYTATPVRQGDKSTPQSQRVENDGNDLLDLTAITPDANAALDGPTTTCNPGTPYMAVAADCTIGAVFAPSVAGNPLIANINLGSKGDTPSAPLDIEMVGDATAVNSTTIAVTSDIDPSSYGQSVKFTATVSTGATSGTPTGTVNFYDGATQIASGVPLTGGATSGATATATASVSIATLTVGVHQITATYSGDKTHFGSNSTDPNGTTPPYPQTVQELTATGLASSANPSGQGQSVTFTATVTTPAGGGIAPDGTVTFTDGANVLGTIALNASGVATYSTSALTLGTHTITAQYNGDTAKYIVGSTSAPLTQDVQGASSVSVSSAPNPSNYGITVTFNATVAAAGTAPATGTVNFLDNGTHIGSGTLSGSPGITSFTTSSLVVGTHTITAQYTGDANNAPSTGTTTQTVNQTQTSTALGATPNPGIAGAPVAITATVKVITGSANTTGTVTFTDNGTVLGSATLTAAGTATINPTLAPGTHSIVATYGGDANDQGSTSAALPLTVVQATTTTGLTSSASPALVLSPITFTAKVTGNGGIPTGTVTFSADGTPIGTATLNATGTAAITTSNLTAGTHQIVASYAGDANDSSSVSAAFSQVVNKIDTTTDLGVASTGGTSPQPILVATVQATTGPKPTGTVTFSNGTTVIGTATLDSSGIATLTPNLALGNYNIVAAYSGDANHNPSSSQPVSVSGTATGFAITVTPASLNLKTTQNTTVTVTLTSQAGFTDTIGLGCASLPAGVTCHFSNISVPLSANSTATAQLTIDTNYPLTGGTTAMNRPAQTGRNGAQMAGLFLPIGALFGLILWRVRRRNAVWLTMLLVAVVSAATLLATGCGGMSTSSAKPGNYVIQVTGTGANSNIIHYQNVTLNITN